MSLKLSYWQNDQLIPWYKYSGEQHLATAYTIASLQALITFTFDGDSDSAWAKARIELNMASGWVFVFKTMP